jgi:YD repeat-containing protein
MKTVADSFSAFGGDRICPQINASFTRPSAPPASSDTILVSETVYDDAGRVFRVIDPMGILNQTIYDSAGRTIHTIEDVGTGSHLRRWTNYTYTLDNLIATLTADNAPLSLQTTT